MGRLRRRANISSAAGGLVGIFAKIEGKWCAPRRSRIARAMISSARCPVGRAIPNIELAPRLIVRMDSLAGPGDLTLDPWFVFGALADIVEAVQ